MAHPFPLPETLRVLLQWVTQSEQMRGRTFTSISVETSNPRIRATKATVLASLDGPLRVHVQDYMASLVHFFEAKFAWVMDLPYFLWPLS